MAFQNPTPHITGPRFSSQPQFLTAGIAGGVYEQKLQHENHFSGPAPTSETEKQTL